MNWNIIPTTEQPLLFFDFFFGSGLREFYHEFMGYSNVDLFGEGNPLKSIVTITNEEADAGATGETVLFEDELFKLLIKQQNLTIKTVVAFFRTCNDCNRCNHYLDVTAKELISLAEGCKDKDLIERYPLILHCVITTIVEMYHSGDRYFPKTPMQIPENVASILEMYNTKTGLQINSRYIYLIEPLFLSLKSQGFIHQDTELKNFESALMGRVLSKSKIRWIKKGKRNTTTISKADIFYFFDKLRKESIIKIDSDTSLKKIVLSNFLDDKGDGLANIHVAFHDYANRGRVSQESECINEIIEGLLKQRLS